MSKVCKKRVHGNGGITLPSAWKIEHDPFLKSTSKFEHFRKKGEPQRLFVSDIIDCKMRGYLNG